jgi:hypothetical protein
MRKLFAKILLFFLVISSFFAQEQGLSQERGDDLTIRVAVLGPGDELYLWWGHMALIIDDTITGQSRFYDWGVFSFDNDDFFVNFAQGLCLYSAMSSPTERSLAFYRKINRDITLYTLDLEGPQKSEIRAFVENNVRPENRNYLYHHFRDNCATRIRDIIDMGTGGQFKDRFGDAPGRYTLRQHVRRHTWFNPFFDWILNFWMSGNIDRPILVWDEMFLPSEIGRVMEGFTYVDSQGVTRSLVTAKVHDYAAVGRHGVLDVPRRQWPRELVAGVALAVVLCLLGRGGKVKGGAKKAYFLLQGVLGLFFGVAGALLFFLTFFTNHDYTWNNVNVIFINPLLLAAVPLSIMALWAKKPTGKIAAEKILGWLWVYVFVAALGCWAIHALPGVQQQNFVTLALVLPWTGLLAGRFLSRRYRRAES